MNNHFERNEINANMEMLIGFCHGASRATIDEKISDTFNYIRNQIVEIYHLINDKNIKNDWDNIDIKTLSFSDRTDRVLFAENIKTVGQLIVCTENRLLKTPNLGKKSLNEIKLALKNIGLSLKESSNEQ